MLWGACEGAEGRSNGVSLATPEKVQKLRSALYEAAKRDRKRRFHQLYDKVWREDVIEHAYAICRSNGGASGVDEVTFERIEAEGREAWLAGLGQELRDRTYEPAAVRRVLIPKPGGGERPLGIPTIRDRVVQTAAKLVLEPIFEADFEDCAYGYRPGRSATDAVGEVERALREGYTDVVDADLSKYFDTIPHQELMRSVARRVSDRHMLKLVKGWLKVPVEERDENGRRRMTGGRKSTKGTPQGGVISPLLANVYMNRYLRAWREHGKGEEYDARIVNYADDFVILSRGNAAAALAWTRWAMGRMGLTLNEKKTSIRDAHREDFDFLGYTFGKVHNRKTGRPYLGARPSKKSVARVKERVHAVLRPGNQSPWKEISLRLNRLLLGWANYFDRGTRFIAYRAVNDYVFERVRYFLRRRHKVRRRGIGAFTRQRVFEELGVPRLWAHPRPRPA